MQAGTEWAGRYAQSRRKTPLSPEAERIRKWLRKTMKERKITQEQLSELTGISQPQINRILTGCSEVKGGLLLKMAESMGFKMVFIPEEQLKKGS